MVRSLPGAAHKSPMDTFGIGIETASRDTLTAALRAVLALHQRETVDIGTFARDLCSSPDHFDVKPRYPCPTVRTIAAALTPQGDFVSADMAAELAETSEWYRTHDRTIQAVD